MGIMTGSLSDLKTEFKGGQLPSTPTAPTPVPLPGPVTPSRP